MTGRVASPTIQPLGPLAEAHSATSVLRARAHRGNRDDGSVDAFYFRRRPWALWGFGARSLSVRKYSNVSRPD